MSGKRYFLEAWLRRFNAPKSTKKTNDYHAHITFVRPFEILKGREDVIMKKIFGYCQGRKPVSFVLEGQNKFGEIPYISVKSDELQEFDSGLEKLLEKDVRFVKKLSERKILHLTLNVASKKPYPKTVATMLRLTCLRDKKIWFSFDFVTQETLNRNESLNKNRWWNSCRMFAQQDS